MNLVWAMLIALVCGGTIGVVYDRYVRRNDEPPPQTMRQMRIRRLHIIDEDRED